MTDKPLVSVIIANWNTTKYMNEECIKAVRAKTAVAVEIIVVDNGSTDASGEEIASAADATIFLQENKGPAYAWNRGIRSSAAPYVCILNSDAVVAQACLDKMLRRAMQKDVGLVGCMSNHTQMHSQRPGPVQEADKEVEPGHFISFVCVMMSRETYEKIGPIDERFVRGTHEDVDYCRRLHDAGKSLVVAGDAFCWLVHGMTYRANKIDMGKADRAMRKVYEKKIAGSRHG
jgi:GT2 family glycosyltransferase